LKKSNQQIVGAYFPKSPSEAQVHTPPKLQDKVGFAKPSSIAPSDEFRAFWGNNVDASWFEGRKLISPFVIFIILLTGLTIYLSSKLLFSPGEIEQMFSEATSPSATQEAQLPASTADDENLLTKPAPEDAKESAGSSETKEATDNIEEKPKLEEKSSKKSRRRRH
jgi:hypothetical protein